MADEQIFDGARKRLTMDYEPPILSGPTSKKTVKGPNGMPLPPGFPGTNPAPGKSDEEGR